RLYAWCCAWPTEGLIEERLRGLKVARGWQRVAIDGSLGRAQGDLVKRGQALREALDKSVELRVGERPVDPAVSLSGGGFEVGGAQHDFERTSASGQQREAFHRAAAGHESHPHFRLAEHRSFETCEAHVEAQRDLAPHATRATSDQRDRDHGSL